MSPASTTPPGQPSGKGSWKRGRWIVLLLALVCAAPVIASYLTYYVFKPTGGTSSYGTLIQPQRPIPPELMVTGDDGKPLKLASMRGRWLMISVDGSACDKACVTKLFFMRQVRATQAGQRERLVPVWLRTDSSKVAEVIRQAYPETGMLVVDPVAVAQWLPTDAGTAVTDHIYVVDPSGNLMMRFPKDPNPSKIKGDVTKLLKYSSNG
ncbi:cytochrome C oxidase subunit I [Paraburkholderia bonniea]|uniref:SCO family protein n=1 Tax=Paraburkholderia bonniea TaxID=2152891 RepID=UPI001C2CA4D1|nr:cytochrome C oxidase subunit I [Paraburkholderia bonniea]WJF91459.1 cytochrome C oxidase subunit I [Paraburkholderia bonniea]WJF94778.1 cytochrome C oxidase subunit I [Paraburkholderia bonniea]